MMMRYLQVLFVVLFVLNFGSGQALGSALPDQAFQEAFANEFKENWRKLPMEQRTRRAWINNFTQNKTLRAELLRDEDSITPERLLEGLPRNPVFGRPELSPEEFEMVIGGHAVALKAAELVKRCDGDHISSYAQLSWKEIIATLDPLIASFEAKADKVYQDGADRIKKKYEDEITRTIDNAQVRNPEADRLVIAEYEREKAQLAVTLRAYREKLAPYNQFVTRIERLLELEREIAASLQNITTWSDEELETKITESHQIESRWTQVFEQMLKVSPDDIREETRNMIRLVNFAIEQERGDAKHAVLIRLLTVEKGRRADLARLLKLSEETDQLESQQRLRREQLKKAEQEAAELAQFAAVRAEEDLWSYKMWMPPALPKEGSVVGAGPRALWKVSLVKHRYPEYESKIAQLVLAMEREGPYQNGYLNYGAMKGNSNVLHCHIRGIAGRLVVMWTFDPVAKTIEIKDISKHTEYRAKLKAIKQSNKDVS